MNSLIKYRDSSIFLGRIGEI